jgi:hypothetical protein
LQTQNNEVISPKLSHYSVKLFWKNQANFKKYPFKQREVHRGILYTSRPSKKCTSTFINNINYKIFELEGTSNYYDGVRVPHVIKCFRITLIS